MTDEKKAAFAAPVEIVEISKACNFSKATDESSLKAKWFGFNDYIDDYENRIKLHYDWQIFSTDFNAVLYRILAELGFDYYSLNDAIYCAKPIQLDSGLIACYPTILDMWKGKTVQMKPGKWFKFFCPILTDKQVESCVAELKAINMVPEFDLIVSQEESAFLEAYITDYLPKRSPRLNNGGNYYLKRLDSSCMQGKWDSSNHPASVYASGDFWIAYTKEKVTGKIGSRVIYTKESSSNIYSVDDKASEILVNHLKENNIHYRSKFEGKRIKRIPYPRVEYGIYTPYIDGYCWLSKLDESFMVIESNNKDTGISCNETRGYTFEVRRRRCNCCDEMSICNHTALDSYHEIVCVCDPCLEKYYIYSEVQENYIAREDSYPNPCNPDDVVTRCWLVRNYYTQCRDGFWRLQSECVDVQGYIYPMDSDEIEEFDGYWYLKNDPKLIKLKKGKGMQKLETWGFKWLMNNGESRYKSPYLEYTCETVEVLRDNFQLNEFGIAERLPELPGLELV